MSEETKASSPKQPLLDLYVKIISEKVSSTAVKESYINEKNAHMPTLIVEKDQWHEVAELLHKNQDLRFDYLMNLSGLDYGEFLEVAYHFYSFSRDEYMAIKVQTDREGGSVPSVMDIWLAADWQEREAYDLVGMGFTGREITRILLPDNWVGHPLRKDYEPHDEGV